MSKIESVSEEKEVASDSDPTGKMAFTPGPWDLIRSSDQRRDGFIRCSRKLTGSVHGLAVGQAFKHGFQYDEYEANARLIAAAPELLEACKAVLESLHSAMVSIGYMTSEINREPSIISARAAIAKAEGRA